MKPVHDPPSPNREEAVALTYNASDGAPRVVAKGRGIIAQEIIARAHEAGVYVHESPELVSLLMQVDLDAHIPSQLYVAVAELLAWLYQVEQHQPAANTSSASETVTTETAAPPPAETVSQPESP